MKISLIPFALLFACGGNKSELDSAADDTAVSNDTSDSSDSSDTSDTSDTTDTSDTNTTADWTTMGVGDLIITEVQNNPCVLGDDINGDGNPDCLLADDLGEWFEVYNTSGRDLELEGLVIRDDDANNPQQFTISQSVVIDEGAYVVFHVNGDSATNGGVSDVVTYNGGDSGFSLSNSSDEIIIETPGGTVIDQLVYDDADFPDTKGYSMTLNPSAFDASANDMPENWCSATSSYGDGDFGTPGAPNDGC